VCGKSEVEVGAGVGVVGLLVDEVELELLEGCELEFLSLDEVVELF
jgi:hypothetical protein